MVSRSLTVSNSATLVRPQSAKHPTCVACNDTEVLMHTHKHRDGTWGVPSFRPGVFVYYWVKLSAVLPECTCPAFQFGKGDPCKHIVHCQNLEAQGLWHDLPASVWRVWSRVYSNFPGDLYDR